MTASLHPKLRIFVSHSHKDNQFGIQLVDDLRRVLGDESAVWFDAWGGLHGGDAWWRKIVEEVTARNVFIVVLSPDSMTSPWVNDEIDLAWRQKNTSSLGKRIFPVLYRECNIREDLRTLQMINFLPPRNYKEAFNELLRALKLPIYTGTSRPSNIVDDPSTATVRQMTTQIEIAFRAKDWPDVIRKINYLLKQAPIGIASDIYRMQGIALLEEGKVQQAQEAFDTALALVSDREQRLMVLRNYINLLAGQNQWNEVLRLSNEALRLAPNDSSWMEMQQQAQSKLKKKTVPLITKKPKGQVYNKKTKEQWLEDGNSYFHTKRYSYAIASYNQAILLDPTYSIAYIKRGDAYAQLKEYEKAIADYDRAIALAPNEARAYNNRGCAYFDLREYEKAIADYDHAITLNVSFALAYSNRGEAYYNLKEHEKAIADCDRAIAIDPTNAEAYYNRGNAYKAIKDYRKAIADYDRAIALERKDVTSYYNRGNAYYSLREYEKAIADFEQVIRVDRMYILAYINRGVAYHDLKEYREAIADYDRAIELDPKNAIAYNNRGNAYKAIKEYEKAIADYDRAIALAPNEARAYNNRGCAYFDLREYEKAIADYDHALALVPNYVKAYNNRRRAYYALQKVREGNI